LKSKIIFNNFKVKKCGPDNIPQNVWCIMLCDLWSTGY